MASIRTSASFALRATRSTVQSRPLSTVRDVPLTGSTLPYQVSAAAPTANALQKALNAGAPRTNWTKEEISEIYNTPLFELHYAAVSCVVLDLDVGTNEGRLLFTANSTRLELYNYVRS
jgi:hypothetical protein